MRRSIRLAVPAATAAVLLLSGCGGDKEGSPFQAPDIEDLEVPEVPELEESEESEGMGDIEVPPPSGDSGGDTGGGDFDLGGDFDGSWEAPASDGNNARLDIYGDYVNYTDTTAYEGDLCNGSLSGDTFTITCSVYGDEAFPETTGTLALNGDSLTVTWGSGTSEEFTRAI
ncbi:hypothetical protein [Streptomyces radicis]|uniref:Lipoprotein n=1 Tax=Streptomyces radicis TaxID=1750517 RepID=A0A3A9VX52_9ACTN|nr:hypothetical protein [Streptomyces radicis]RKN05528.1 hypothetical protein D7319_24955 [Streptomyces radicis]RKN17397.1 hypothetical protein D7318_24320 [Streptomyces radicis]